MGSPRDTLVEALKDVEEANVPDDLREIAFAKAFDLRAGAVPVGPAPPQSQHATHGTRGLVTQPSGDPIADIAARLEIGEATAGEVFTAYDGEIELIVPAAKLSSKTASATKEIALLVAGARQAAGLEEWTSWDHIRRVCSDFRRLDSGNFAKTVREMDDVFNFRKDSDRKVSVRLAKPGWERFAHAVRRLGGE